MPMTTTTTYGPSFPQLLWCSGGADASGFFAPMFVLSRSIRIRGPLDVSRLRACLDELVTEHDALRTRLVIDGSGPRAVIESPEPFPLHVRVQDTPPTWRDVVALDLARAAQQLPVDPQGTPLARGVLTELGHHDAVLSLVVHHTCSDEWSMGVLVEELVDRYASADADHRGRASATPIEPYAAFARAEREQHAPAAVAHDWAHWAARMRGARIVAAPTDRPHPGQLSQPHTTHTLPLPPRLGAAVQRHAEVHGVDVEVVLLAAVSVLAAHVTGTTAPAIDTLTTGRRDPQFDRTVGSVMNFLVYATELDDCPGFGDVVARTARIRDDALAHEVPIAQIEELAPDLMAPNDTPRTAPWIVGTFNTERVSWRLGDSTLAELVIDDRESTATGPWIPHGMAWNVHQYPDAQFVVRVQFNSDELDSTTVAGWAQLYAAILGEGVESPSQPWRTLGRAASL